MSATKVLSDEDCLHYWELQCGFNDVIRAAFAAGQRSAVEDAATQSPVATGVGAYHMAFNMLVAAGFVTGAKANEALNIAHGFLHGPLTASDATPAPDEDDDPGCEICHEPLGDGCPCQNSYGSEHDSGAER